jgi:hypothetical protein
MARFNSQCLSGFWGLAGFFNPFQGLEILWTVDKGGVAQRLRTAATRFALSYFL